MRKDIYERIQMMKKEDIKPNYAAVARQYGCDYRTAKKYYETDESDKPPAKQKKSKLDPYKSVIKEKLAINCTAMSIYRFILKKGYTGKYEILRAYCKTVRQEEEKKATIRFETTPGLQGQVDWKENLKIYDRSNNEYEINIFCIVLGYSRKKYIEMTMDRSQDTLFRVMINAFKSFGGIPKEILFDNMKTVIDQSKSNYKDVVINESFYQFSKDMGFQVISCRPYRPQTKGKVENLAKFTSRLIPYNNEFSDAEELYKIVQDINNEMNDEISQATNKKPNDLFEKEKEYLLPLPNQELLDEYLTKPIERIVSKESMITYMYNKYSVDPQYIGKTVNIEVQQDTLIITYKTGLIATHKITEKKFNYDKEHYKKILKSDAYKDRSDEEIEKAAARNLKQYDKL